MNEQLKVEGFFSYASDGVKLSESGGEEIKKILGKFSGRQIKEIAGVSRSALINYTKNANKTSKRGQEALKILIIR